MLIKKVFKKEESLLYDRFNFTIQFVNGQLDYGS